MSRQDDVLLGIIVKLTDRCRRLRRERDRARYWAVYWEQEYHRLRDP